MGDIPKTERQVARALILDERNRLLLLHGGDPANLAASNWWFTPGGGVEGTETLSQACSREIWEETGLQIQVAGNPIWERVASFNFMGHEYHQREFFFVVRTQHFEPASKALSEIEQLSLIGSRWWEQNEIESSTETIYPEELKTHFAELLAPRHGIRALAPELIELPQAAD